MSKRTVCEACGFGSYNGRVCAYCRKFYGGDTENVLAATALSKRCRACRTFEDIFALLSSLVDVVAIDWPARDMHGLVHTLPAPPIGGAGMEVKG